MKLHWPLSFARCLALGIALAIVLAAPAKAASLRDVLTPEEFDRAGLGKLTPQELAYLSDRVLPRLAERAAATETTPSPAVTSAPSTVSSEKGEAAFGRELQIQEQAVKSREIPKQIDSRIAGRFEGWSGRTTFSLENGQVWQQAEPGSFVAQLDAPRVTIRKGLLGVFYLRVEGYGTQVKVKRVK